MQNIKMQSNKKITKYLLFLSIWLKYFNHNINNSKKEEYYELFENVIL
jgi:hypothetical protein